MNLHLSDPGSEVDLLAQRTLVHAWLARWRAAPERVVITTLGQPWLTGADLEQRSRDGAAVLAAAGAQPGDRVVLSGEPSVEFVVAYMSALRLGLVVVPMNTAYREREVSHVVRDAEPAVAVVDDDERAGWISRAWPAVAVMPMALDGPRRAVPLDQVAPSDPALIGYTSGTTGAPKGAVLSHANLLSSAEALRLAWRWAEHDRLLLALPLFHMHGLGVGVNGTLLAGASAVLVPKFEPGLVLGAIAPQEVTLFFGVPTMYTRLVAHESAAELSRLRLCVSGSAPLPPDLFAAVAAAAGRPPIERYGMTETVMLVSNPYDGERRAGSVGFPLPGVEVRLDETTAEICVRGPNVFSGYWRRPEATAEAFTADGFFRTGDVGQLDADGYLRIVGRTKELIITGGFNVYPREIEDVLRAHPAVADVAVIGVASPEWGETVVACVERTPGAPGAASEKELLEFAAAQLAPYKKPRAVHFVESLPRNALGKVVRAELAKAIRLRPQ